MLIKLGILQQLASGQVCKDRKEAFWLAGTMLGEDMEKLRRKEKIFYLIVLPIIFHSRAIHLMAPLESGSVIMVQYAASVHS